MLKTSALALAGAAAAALLLAGGASGQDMARTHSFLAKAAASDMFEIAEARLVTERSRNPQLRRFAARMVHDHTASSAKLKEAGETAMGHKLPPPEMSSQEARMLDDLKAARGRDFDKTYVKQQLGAHEEALGLMSNYAKTRDYPRIAEAAGEIAPTVQMHLTMIRSLKREVR